MFAELGGFIVLDPTPVPSPFVPPFALVPGEVIPDPPCHAWHPTNDSRAVDFSHHLRDEVMAEQIHIGLHSDKILRQMREDGHSRHCIWREVKEVEPIDVHDCIEELGEGGTEAADEVSSEDR